MLVKLLEYVEIISGGTPKTTNSEYWNGDIPWLAIDDFRDVNKYVYETQKLITKKGLENSSTNILRYGDIIISARGTVGKIALIHHDMAFNQSCFGIRIKNKQILNSNFLFYYLKCNLQYILKKSQGAIFDSINLSTFDYIKVDLPPIEIQEKIASILTQIDDQIEQNNVMVKKLQVLSRAIFNRFFSDETNCVSLLDFPYTKILKPGISKFEGQKHYIATAEVGGDKVNFDAPLINYETRENRANMQPIKNSVWFAKMKNSVKHLYISKEDRLLLSDYILSTGFCGLECDDFAFEYMINYIILPYFENKKNILSHGATMKGVNNDDLKSMHIHLPSKERLVVFHSKTKEIHCQISRINQKTFELTKLKKNCYHYLSMVSLNSEKSHLGYEVGLSLS